MCHCLPEKTAFTSKYKRDVFSEEHMVTEVAGFILGKFKSSLGIQEINFFQMKASVIKVVDAHLY